MTSIASPTVSLAFSVTTGALITLLTGSSSDRPGSTTRPSTSLRVKMPTTWSLSAAGERTTITAPTRSCSIRSKTVRRLSSGAQVTGARPSIDSSGALIERQWVVPAA